MPKEGGGESVVSPKCQTLSGGEGLTKVSVVILKRFKQKCEIEMTEVLPNKHSCLIVNIIILLFKNNGKK